jgi:hypothetical protein
MNAQRQSVWVSIAISALLCVGVAGCGKEPVTAPRPSGVPSTRVATGPRIELPEVEARAGTAVAILVDTSGSMAHSVRDRGKQQPKHQIAREALGRIVQYTGQWKKKNPERPLYVGIYHFSSSVAPVLPMAEFDEAKAKAAVARIPGPTGGTAIGRALEEAFKALYGSGCVRKYVVCITDGENTSGPPPEGIARQLFDQTKGEVEIHFVAFDIAANRFRFLEQVNGKAVEAADAEQLQSELSKIYEKRILAEAEEPAEKK